MPIRWFDVAIEFGMHTPQKSKVFWEVLEPFTATKQYLLTLRYYFLRRWALMYANSIYNRGSTLDRCVGFLDSTEVAMCRPGGHASLQRSV